MIAIPALLALFTSGASAQEDDGQEAAPPKKQAAEEEDRTSFGGKAFLGGGALAGEGIIAGAGPVAVVSTQAEPALSLGPTRIAFPVDLSHRQTFGISLSELQGEAALEVGVHPDDGEIAARGGIRGRYRPEWPDPYQPQADGTLLPTDRWSYVAGFVGLDGRWDVAKPVRLSADYEYQRLDSKDDPNFDPVDHPTHIPPEDGWAHAGEVSLRLRSGPLRVTLGSTLEWKGYLLRYARDAGTGLTHAGPGGDPPNPLYREIVAEPAVEARLAPKGAPWKVRAGYGLEMQEDLFEGYYSYLGHHPTAGLDLALGEVCEVAVRGEVSLRTYGPDSYAVGGSHPALDWGDRRVDRRYGGSVDLDFPVTRSWIVSVSGDALVRRTNFPDYVPGVFPAGGAVDIDWDYEDLRVLAGVEYTWR
jgi:hypothetical protein